MRVIPKSQVQLYVTFESVLLFSKMSSWLDGVEVREQYICSIELDANE